MTYQLFFFTRQNIRQLNYVKMARRYCFTINNPTEDDRRRMADLLPLTKYAIYGEEVGASGTPHVQGYVSLTKKVRFAAFCALLPRAHVELCKGTALQQVEYLLSQVNQ